ncbi:hypothetical protein C8R45DRAFT_921374 [Mycena sanguinolenta]|nr:hypothetical protein C8R45DRAFT_921374 [Mycena sanguinolenta]
MGWPHLSILVELCVPVTASLIFCHSSSSAFDLSMVPPIRDEPRVYGSIVRTGQLCGPLRVGRRVASEGFAVPSSPPPPTPHHAHRECLLANGPALSRKRGPWSPSRAVRACVYFYSSSANLFPISVFLCARIRDRCHPLSLRIRTRRHADFPHSRRAQSSCTKSRRSTTLVSVGGAGARLIFGEERVFVTECGCVGCGVGQFGGIMNGGVRYSRERLECGGGRALDWVPVGGLGKTIQREERIKITKAKVGADADVKDEEGKAHSSALDGSQSEACVWGAVVCGKVCVCAVSDFNGRGSRGVKARGGRTRVSCEGEAEKAKPTEETKTGDVHAHTRIDVRGDYVLQTERSTIPFDVAEHRTQHILCFARVYGRMVQARRQAPVRQSVFPSSVSLGPFRKIQNSVVLATAKVTVKGVSSPLPSSTMSSNANAPGSTFAPPQTFIKSKSDWLGPALMTVRVVAASAQLVPIPGVQAAFNTAQTVLEAVEKVKTNRDNLKLLCEHITEIVNIIQAKLSSFGEKVIPELETRCREFDSALQDVLVIVQKMQDKRSFLKEMFRTASIADDIKTFEDKIRNLHTKFMVRFRTLSKP